jgi:hypothetical protein
MSAALCILAAISMVFGTLLITSVSLGTALPTIFSGDWAVAYTNDVVRPLLALLANVTLTNGVFLALWAIVGLAVYFAIDYGIRSFRGLRTARHAVRFTAEGVTAHSTMSTFLVALVWRLGVLVLILPLLIVAMQYTLSRVNSTAPNIVVGAATGRELVLQLAVLIVMCTGVFHLFVVCTRLFTMRVRLFSNESM